MNIKDYPYIYNGYVYENQDHMREVFEKVRLELGLEIYSTPSTLKFFKLPQERQSYIFNKLSDLFEDLLKDPDATNKLVTLKYTSAKESYRSRLAKALNDLVGPAPTDGDYIGCVRNPKLFEPIPDLWLEGIKDTDQLINQVTLKYENGNPKAIIDFGINYKTMTIEKIFVHWYCCGDANTVKGRQVYNHLCGADDISYHCQRVK